MSPLQEAKPVSIHREAKKAAMEIKDVKEDAEVVAVPSRFRRICVFCGSSHGKKKSYQDAAIELGKELVSFALFRSPFLKTVARNINLVYGGGSVGLMGLVSQAVYNGGRHVLGVIPKALMPREISGETVGEVKAVADMHQRKAEMARQSDAFIALPGIEKTFKTIAMRQVGLLNVDGYYKLLLSFIDKAVEEGFVRPTARHIIVLAPTPKELIDKLEEYSPHQHEEITPKMKWELEQLSHSQNHEVPVPKEGTMITEQNGEAAGSGCSVSTNGQHKSTSSSLTRSPPLGPPRGDGQRPPLALRVVTASARPSPLRTASARAHPSPLCSSCRCEIQVTLAQWDSRCQEEAGPRRPMASTGVGGSRRCREAGPWRPMSADGRGSQRRGEEGLRRSMDEHGRLRWQALSVGEQSFDSEE
ncbi:hypothetical protein PR202_gb09121 [Eleusine coracana subsp. coracana]|uniref:cytokinin riboside 5'-monophosphate phosphoribohydrolase n=1 Tax=Eleusine coracana subsp. coracana TaxID=191504 RepID=A0AAV5EGG9_ELECO|nr:hypothetical protein PR202_gb09121 [Eleusine coracana subsp. coracana]